MSRLGDSLDDAIVALDTLGDTSAVVNPAGNTRMDGVSIVFVFYIIAPL